MPEPVAIEVVRADEQEALSLDLDRYAELVAATLAAEGVRPPAEVSLSFVDEAAIAELNERHMGKQGPTDVLSFPIEDEPLELVPEGEAAPLTLLGDIVVCPAVAARNAPEHGQSTEDELALLCVHGALHLLGWDHVVDQEAERMEAREAELLALLHHRRGES